MLLEFIIARGVNLKRFNVQNHSLVIYKHNELECIVYSFHSGGAWIERISMWTLKIRIKYFI